MESKVSKKSSVITIESSTGEIIQLDIEDTITHAKWWELLRIASGVVVEEKCENVNTIESLPLSNE